MYWKLLLPTKYAFQRSTTKGLFYPAEQKLYPLDIMRPLIDEIDWGSDDIQWDNDRYSNLFLSSRLEWDNDFVVSQTSSTVALSVPDSTTSSWETPDPGLVVTEQITESDIDTDDIADIDVSSSESSSPDNPFINFEAEEATSSEDEPARKIRRR